MLDVSEHTLTRPAAPEALVGPSVPPAPAVVEPATVGESRELGRQLVTAYASAPEAERYRRIMRVFYENKARDLGWRLTPEAVSGKLRDSFELVLPADTLSGALDQLVSWGALDRDNDTSDVTSAQEWRRKRFSYDITAAGERFERLLIELDGLEEQAGSLESKRLPGIRDALRRIAARLTEPPADEREEVAVALREDLEYLVAAIGELRQGASDFMSRVGRVVSAAETIDEDEFTSYKGKLIEHLEGFHRALRLHSEEIIEAIGQVDAAGPERLIELVASVDQSVAFGGITEEELAARRRAEIAGRWHGVRSWFVADTHQQQTWNVLNQKVLEAIKAVLDIAERLVERAANRADRASAWEQLAAVCNAAGETTAVQWFAAALGMIHPRHFNTPEADPGEVRHPAQTSWAQAPAAPVAAHLRTPGSRRPGAGRGVALKSNAEVAAEARARRALERREIAALSDRFAGRGPVALADIGELSRTEFAHVVEWIGRAFEAPADEQGRRRASSLDIQLEIVLTPPADPADRAVLHTADGRLSCPNYTLEVCAG